MYTKQDLIQNIFDIGIKPEDTLLVHSSMKSIGEVKGGADTVLDAFMEYMKPGLLIFPTHTWEQMNSEHNVFNPLYEPSCIGVLSNLFMRRTGVIRSWHPTHSVAAIGKDSKEYVSGEENWDTPCARKGCWGKLYDRKAKILFLGCSLRNNTLLHGVEEWNGIKNRFTEKPRAYKILTPDGRLIERPVYGHYCTTCDDISKNYIKMEAPFIYNGIARIGFIGDAVCTLCDAVGMVELTTNYLKIKPDLFGDFSPVPQHWYRKQAKAE